MHTRELVRFRAQVTVMESEPYSDHPPFHPNVVHQPGACVVKGAPVVREGQSASGEMNVVLFNDGFSALSYFHVAVSDDYLFTGADDEILSFDAQATITHDKILKPKVPPDAILILDLGEPDPPRENLPGEETRGTWYYDPHYFSHICITAAAGALNVITENPTDTPVGLNVLVTRRRVCELDRSPVT